MAAITYTYKPSGQTTHLTGKTKETVDLLVAQHHNRDNPITSDKMKAIRGFCKEMGLCGLLRKKYDVSNAPHNTTVEIANDHNINRGGCGCTAGIYIKSTDTDDRYLEESLSLDDNNEESELRTINTTSESLDIRSTSYRFIHGCCHSDMVPYDSSNKITIKYTCLGVRFTLDCLGTVIAPMGTLLTQLAYAHENVGDVITDGSAFVPFGVGVVASAGFFGVYHCMESSCARKGVTIAGTIISPAAALAIQFIFFHSDIDSFGEVFVPFVVGFVVSALFIGAHWSLSEILF